MMPRRCWAVFGRHFRPSGYAVEEQHTAIGREMRRTAMGGKDRDRTVYQRPDNSWVNKRNDADKASSIHKTQGEAVKTAKAMLLNQGGGELVVKGRHGAPI